MANCAVYFNYRDLVTLYGGKKAKAVAAVYIQNVFSYVESSATSSRMKLASLLTNDTLDETTDSSYGAIAVFTYTTLTASETAATHLIDWIKSENKRLAVMLPILGVVHSKNGTVLSAVCASNLFNTSLSFAPTIFCLDDTTFAKHQKISRVICDGRSIREGFLICSRPGKYFVLYCEQKGIRMIGKEDAVHIVEDSINKQHENGLIVYSYDGGNLLYDCAFVSYIKTLYAITTLTKKKIIISPDIRTMSNKISSSFVGKITLSNVVSYFLGNKVVFSKDIASDKALVQPSPYKYHVPYVQSDVLFK